MNDKEDHPCLRRATPEKLPGPPGASTYQQDLADEIATSSKVRMDAWTARDRIPMRVRVMARLSARPLHLPTRSAPQ
jgi:hypothetical protein